MAKTYENFLKVLNLKYPLVVAPMAGGPSSPELVAAGCQAGALGSIGSAYSKAPDIRRFVQSVRSKTQNPFAINLFIPSQIQEVDSTKIENAIRATQKFRDEFKLPRPQLVPPYEDDFDQQFEAVLSIKPRVLSFVFGLLPDSYLKAAREAGIYLIGTATTVGEACALQDSKVDAITLQGFEAGGHRGIFDSSLDDPNISMMELLLSTKKKVSLPLLAAGGIMSSEDIKSALSAGASAVQMGTAFLATEEAGTSKPYRNKLLEHQQRKTKLTRAFSGRLARGIENRFMQEIEKNPEAILPFPAQNKFTRDLRKASVEAGSAELLSLWSGSGQGSLWTGSAQDLIHKLFES